MSEVQKEKVIFTQVVWKEAVKQFRTAVTEVYSTTYAHMEVETSKALLEHAKRLREGGD